MNYIKTLILLLIASTSWGASYDQPNFVAADTGAKIKTMNIYGADAQTMFTFIKTETPSSYTQYSGPTYRNEHVRGTDIFCVKDSQVKNGQIISSTYRCSFNVSGRGQLAPELLYIGNDGP